MTFLKCSLVLEDQVHLKMVVAKVVFLEALVGSQDLVILEALVKVEALAKVVVIKDFRSSLDDIRIQY